MRRTLRWFNLGLRSLMELGLVIALGFVGYHLGGSVALRWVLVGALPVAGFGFWGMVDFHQAGAAAEPLRLAQELVVSGAAAVGWYWAGQHVLGWALGAVSLLHHALVYPLGGTLLKERPRPGRGGEAP